MTKQYVSFCPKCKSENVENAAPVSSSSGYDSAFSGKKCLDCGFEGVTFPELEKTR